MSGTVTGTASWRNPLRGLRTVWGAGAFLLLLSSPVAVQAQATQVTNVAEAGYVDAAGNPGSAAASTTFLTGRRVGVEVQPSRVVQAAAGSILILGHTVRNVGDDVDSFTLGAASASGWPLELYLDVNGDGLLDAGDVPVTEVLSLAAGGLASILVRTVVPATFSWGQVERVTVDAVSTQDPAVRDSAVDEIRPPEPVPALRLVKQVQGPAAVKVGDVVTYRIVATNASTDAVIRDLVVTDHLPPELELVSTAPAQSGGAWQVSVVAPGDSAVFTLMARVSAAPVPGPELVNRATAVAGNGGAAAEDTAVVVVRPAAAAGLVVELSAAVLEVAAGETAMLVAAVRNPGEVILHDVQVELRLPPGTRFVPGSLVGAELFAVRDDLLIVRLPAPLVVGGRVAFSYSIAIVSPRSESLLSVAVASALDGGLVSNEDDAVLRLRRNRPTETRTVVGRVWADYNGDGRHDPDEPGISGVDVWSADGAVARTDEQGKFSFINMRVATHHFRVDPATLPAGFAVPSRGDGIASVRVTGWNTPQVLLPVWPAELAMAGYATAANGSMAGAMPAPPAPVKDDADSVRVQPARTAAEREAEVRASLATGPGVRITADIDGAVTASNRILVMVEAEPLVPLALFRGDTLIAETRTLQDGTYEFVSTPLLPGTNTLRVRVLNSWNQVRWDSVRVHLSGAPAHLELDTATVVLPADGRTRHTVRFRVLDEWGVPVVSRPHVTVAGEEVIVTSDDSYPSSLGIQVQADATGRAAAEFRSGGQVGHGAITVSAGEVAARVKVELAAPVLPLMLTGTGQVGIGAAPDAYGVITARGRVAEGTALTVSLDTRRLDDGQGAFGRSVDPFSEGHYPILGDATERRYEAAARGRLAARLERGLDFVAAGDIQTTLGSGENTLARYSRSLTGAAARVGTGPLVWTGFGAMSAQSLRQVQLRGLGTSGPYIVDQALIPGTEQVHVELRDRDNAQRLLTRRVLVPFVDYQIDYRNGTILLKQPLPAADQSGNPVFLVVTAETAGSGSRAGIWGARVQGDVAGFASGVAPGTVAVGASAVHDGQGLAAVNLIAADVRVAAVGGVEFRGEVAHSAVADSSGFAADLAGRATLLAGRLAVNGRWSRTDESFRNPSSVGTLGGSEDVAGGIAALVAGGELRLEHSRSEFFTAGISRSRTALAVRQPVTGTAQVEGRLTNDQVAGGAAGRSGGAGEVRLTWTPRQRLRLWGESRTRLWAGESEAATSDYIGGGAAIQLMRDVAMEARYLHVTAGDGNDYSVTSLGLRSALLGGTQAWGSYQLVGGIDGATNAALVGLNHRLVLGRDWKINALFERRAGIDRAPVDDPVRALPFLQPESDYWSGGLGVEFLPDGEPYRLSAKAERKEGDAETFTLGALAGDVALGGSFALLARQEFMLRDGGPSAAGAVGRTQRRSSIMGLALRPADHDHFNALVEFRWLLEQNPRGAGLLSGQRDDERLIGAAEVIWSPFRRLELGARYAHRRARTGVPLPDFPAAAIHTEAGYLGARTELEVTRWLGLRGEARLLDERRTGARTWDAAPALVLHALEGIELTAGHRWGDLRDRDFAVNGGEGFFLTLGARMTERTLPTAAAFWRSRIGGNGAADVRLDRGRPAAGPGPAVPPAGSDAP